MTTQAAQLRRNIEGEARRLGFDLFGICAPETPPHLDVYLRWLRQGRHGEMAYLAAPYAQERRAHPNHILPECRSILVLGMHYPAPTLPAADSPAQPTGRVAAYAWGEDYHDVLLSRMRHLTSFIESNFGTPLQSRCYTDTGAILERDLAQRAGLGWIGKNTCLIHPRRGSFFLLAEILLSVDLEPDPPFSGDHCGRCRRCLDACPTGAILPDRTLDARRCISYLTIELKGPIPLELRPLTGNWVFGCDICQQVCPWNQHFSSQAGGAGFPPRPGVSHPNLLQELGLSQAEFSPKFKGSPIKRAKRRGYLRNVAVALGNLGLPEAVPLLEQALQAEPEPLVRGHVAWALGQIGGQQALSALQRAAAVEQDAYVLGEIQMAEDRTQARLAKD